MWGWIAICAGSALAGAGLVLVPLAVVSRSYPRGDGQGHDEDLHPGAEPWGQDLEPEELDYLDCIEAMLDALEPGDEEQVRVMLTHPPVPPTSPDGSPTLVAFYPSSYDRGRKRGPSHWHRAVDLRLRRRTPILAVCDGPVIVGPEGSQCAARGGHCVRILDEEVGLEWYYAHLDEPPLAHPGEYVRAGQVIGFAGNSGNAKNTLCHLHLQCKLHVPIAGVNRYPNFYCGLRRWFPKNPPRSAWPSSCAKTDATCSQCIPREEAEAWARSL